MQVLSKAHQSTPRVEGSFELLASAARTASVDVAIEIAIGVKQLYIEIDCTADPALAIVTPELLVVLPSGTLLSLGTGELANDVGGFTSGWGLGADAEIGTKLNRIMIEGMPHVLRMNHTDGDSITYSVAAVVF